MNKGIIIAISVTIIILLHCCCYYCYYMEFRSLFKGTNDLGEIHSVK